MEKLLKKYGVLNCIGTLMDIMAFILFIVAAFVNKTTPDTILKVVGLVLFVVGSLIMAISSKEHNLAKSIFVLATAGFLMSWLFPAGSFSGADYYEYEFVRIGLADIGFQFYYSVYFLLDKIGFLLVLAGVYGVLSHIKAYQRLIDDFASVGSKHPIIASVIISVILFIFTSLFTQTFIVLVFVPFFISILARMGMDKLTSFAITFGSVLVGILGCTYGTDTLAVFNQNFGTDLEVGLKYRFIIAAVSLVLYNFFIVMRVRKVLKNTKKTKKNAEEIVDPFAVAKYEKTKKKSVKDLILFIISIVFLVIGALVLILGYVDFNEMFGIEIFDKFHDWLIKLEAGEDFTIFSYILGANANALGAFKYIFTCLSVLIVISIILAFMERMSINEYIESFYEGMKKMFKPLLFLIGVNLVFTTCYITSSPIITIYNWFLNLVEGFNPFITSITAFVASLFQVDLGYVAYSVGGFANAVYTDNIEIVHTIFTSMYGIVQVFMPTSFILVTGLALTKVSYKEWLKYIWLFAVGMIVILLVLFTVLTYI